MRILYTFTGASCKIVYKIVYNIYNFVRSREVILTVFPIPLSRLSLRQIQCRYVFLMLGYGGEASSLFHLDDFYLYAERFASALL
jgi:hypothetical protein